MGRDTGSFPCSPENSVLAFTCSGTDSQNSPLCSFLPATNGNLLLPEIEDLEKGAFEVSCVSGGLWFSGLVLQLAGLAREPVVQLQRT